MGVGFLNRTGAEIGFNLINIAKKTFLLLKKLKNTESAQLWPVVPYGLWICLCAIMLMCACPPHKPSASNTYANVCVFYGVCGCLRAWILFSVYCFKWIITEAQRHVGSPWT